MLADANSHGALVQPILQMRESVLKRDELESFVANRLQLILLLLDQLHSLDLSCEQLMAINMSLRERGGNGIGGGGRERIKCTFNPCQRKPFQRATRAVDRCVSAAS